MKMIYLFMGVVAISGSAMGQTSVLQTAWEQPASQSALSETTAQGGLMKKDGKMWRIEPLSDSIAMDNGMVLYMNGNYRTKKGKSYTLKNGGRIDFLGAVEDMDQRINDDSGMVLMDNGSVWVWNLLLKPVQLTNGSYVSPNGQMQLSNGEYIVIDDKTFIDFNGNLIAKAW